MEIAKDIAGDAVFVARMANAQTDAAEFCADMVGDRTDAVMARRAAAKFNLHLEWRKVELVIKDSDVFGFKLIKIHRRAHAAAAFVHERCGF